MIVRVMQAGEATTHGQMVQIPNVGLCQVVDNDAGLTTASQLTTWLQAARTAAQGTTLLRTPKLAHVNQSPDKHMYLALDGNGKVVAQVTAS